MDTIRTPLTAQLLAALRAGDAGCPDVPQQQLGPESAASHLLEDRAAD